MDLLRQFGALALHLVERVGQLVDERLLGSRDG
jgi:hypothetical protein